MTEYQQSKVREELEKHEELNQLFIRYPQECNIDYILKEVKLFNDELEKQGKLCGGKESKRLRYGGDGFICVS